MVETTRFHVSKTYRHGGKELLVTAVSLADRTSIPVIPGNIERVFRNLAPHAKQNRYMLLIRDTDGMEVIRDKYPFYWTRGAHEGYIGLRHWKTVNSTALLSAISSCLYTGVRNEYVYPFRIGERIVASGAASLFANFTSRWTAPWLQEVINEESRADVFRRWAEEPSKPYLGVPEENIEEFEARLGLNILGQHFTESFDIEESLTTPVDAFRKYVLG